LVRERLGAIGAAAIATLALAACSNLLALKDLEPYPADGAIDGLAGGDSSSDDGATTGNDGATGGDAPQDGPASHDATSGDAPSDATEDGLADGPVTGDAPPDGNCGGGKTDCNGSCTDTTSDGQNCGACGHSCQGGTCLGSRCQPVTLASLDAVDIVVVGTTAYWVDGVSPNGNVWSCDVNACTPSALKSMQAQPLRIAFDGAHTIFWTDHGSGSAVDGAVWSYDLNTKMATEIAPSRASPEGITADASYVYWAEDFTSSNQIVQYERSTQTVTNIPLAGTSPYSAALGAGELYFTETGTGAIGQCAEGSCGSPTAFQSVQTTPLAVWVDSTWVYWTDYGNAGAVWRAAIATGSPSQLPGMQANPERVVSDGSDVYWTDNGTTSCDGALVGCAQPACSAATTLQSNLQRPVGLALDAHAIYYGTTGDQRLHKLAR
jgi:hypothetical protein